MTTLVIVLRIIIQIFPALVELVRAIESACGGLHGIGPQKLDLLKGVVEDIHSALAPEDRKAITLERLILAAVSIANRIVPLFNAVGWPK